MLANLTGYEFIPAAAVLVLGLAANLFPEVRWFPRLTLRWSELRLDNVVEIVAAATPGATSAIRDAIAARVLDTLGDRYGDIAPAPVDLNKDYFTAAAYRWHVTPRFAARLPDWYIAIDFHENARRSGAQTPDGYTPRRLRTDREDFMSVSLCAAFADIALSTDDLERLDECDPNLEIEHLGREFARRREFDTKLSFDPRGLRRALDQWCEDLVETAVVLGSAPSKGMSDDEQEREIEMMPVAPEPSPAPSPVLDALPTAARLPEGVTRS